MRGALPTIVAFAAVACSGAQTESDGPIIVDLAYEVRDMQYAFCQSSTPPAHFVEVSCKTAPSGYCFDTIAPPFF